MAATTVETLIVDGILLNTWAKNITDTTGRQHIPGVIGDNTPVAGRDGAIYSSYKQRDEGTIILPMWVQGCDDSGLVSPSARALYLTNRDALIRLFTAPGLRHLVQTMNDGSQRECYAECVQAIDFNMIDHFSAEFAVELRVPDVYWRDVNNVVQATAAALVPSTVHLNSFDAATAPLDELTLQIDGPATNPRLTDPVTGAWVQYTGALASGQSLIIDTSAWTATVGGVSVVANITHGGSNYGKFLILRPDPTTGFINVTIGMAGNGANTKLTVTGRRKYMVV